MRHFESILGRLHEIRARGADVPMSIRHLSVLNSELISASHVMNLGTDEQNHSELTIYRLR